MNDNAELQTAVLDPATVLSLMLPPGCTMEAVDIDQVQIDSIPGYLLPDAAVESRRQEFAAGRVAASGALKALTGNSHFPDVGPHREPLWPSGITGSITHDDRHAIAVTARTSQFASIGIDLEKKQRLDAAIESQVLSADELQRLKEPQTSAVLSAPVAAFAYKEAIFKCSFPISNVFLDFRDVELYVEDNEILSRCTDPGNSVAKTIAAIRGRVVTTEDYVIALCWLPA